MPEPTTVLICDDEHHIRLVLGSKLKSLGFVVIEARDGAEALDLARVHRPRAVVSDYQMPGVDGLEFSTRLKADPQGSDIPVVLLTSRGHAVDPAVLARTNIKRIVDKPFSARDVASLVQSMLEAGGADARDVA